MNKQASLLAAAARTAEVSGLKRDLERTEGDLGLVKRQLEESQDTQYLIYIVIKDKWCLMIEASFILIVATTEVAALKKALSEAEDKSAKERTEHEKQEARDDEV